MNAILRGFAYLLSLSFLPSCASSRFEKDWKRSVASEEVGPVSGPWTGTWKTTNNGHSGNLRCLVSPLESDGKDTYKFRYHATWAKIFRGGYTAEYDVIKSGDGYLVKGTKDLGIFGEFTHDGRIEGDTFNADFEASTGDKGGFYLKRPE